MAKKYIPDNSCLMCDKGSSPCRLKVTHHNNSKIYGEFLASEMDMIPGENIQPMGICSVTNSVCQPQPIYWDKTNKGVKVNGYKLLFEDANLLCRQGGKVSVSFEVPLAASVTGLGAGSWLFGSYQGTVDYIQRGIIYDVEHSKISLVRENSVSDFRRHGNYGEMKDNVFHRQEGWRDARRAHPLIDLDKPTSPGIDGAYVKGSNLKTTDAKYNTATIQNTNNGRELSRRWTLNHLENNNAINSNDKASFIEANNNGTLEREVIRTKPDGTMSSENININGNKVTRGQSEALEIKTGRTSNFINGVRSSIQNSKYVNALAQSNFSQTIRNSKLANVANNKLFQASQAFSRSSALRVTGKVVGKGLIVVGIAMEAANIYNAYQEEGEFGEKTQEAVGEGVGALAGGLAGAQLGAIIGTAICPGVGTVVGGLLGGVIGGIAGSSLGGAIADLF